MAGREMRVDVPSKDGPWLMPDNITGDGVAVAPASALLDAWVPLLIEQFGSEWFEMGTISCSSLNQVLTTTHVRASLEQLPSWRKDTFRGGQLTVWMVSAKYDFSLSVEATHSRRAVTLCVRPPW
jgi:hypothetical protein